MEYEKVLGVFIETKAEFNRIRGYTINKSPNKMFCKGYVSGKTFRNKIYWEETFFILEPWQTNIVYLYVKDYREGFVLGLAKFDCTILKVE